MNILICDDDKISVERMKEYVQDFFRDRKLLIIRYMNIIVEKQLPENLTL